MFRNRVGGWRLVTLVCAWASVYPACGFETGIPLSFNVQPATIRQRGDTPTTKVEAIIMLKAPTPTLFLCKIRSGQELKISFPAVIFKKGEFMEKCVGVVHWKAVPRDIRVRISAYNTDAPDRQLSFTVTLKPVPAGESEDEKPAQKKPDDDATPDNAGSEPN